MHVGLNESNPAYSTFVKDFCTNLGKENNIEPYYTYASTWNMSSKWDGSTTHVNNCTLYERIKNKKVLQNPEAKGLSTVSYNTNWSLTGITYLEPEMAQKSLDKYEEEYTVEYDENNNLNIEKTSLQEYLKAYQEELESQDIKINNVSMLTFSTLLNALQTLSSENIVISDEFEEDYCDYYPSPTWSFCEYKLNLKEIVGEKYKWLYDTNYWLGSGYIDYIDWSNDPEVSANYYITAEGKLGIYAYSGYSIGSPTSNGLRPVITIPQIYKINTNTNGKGRIEVASILLLLSVVLAEFFHKKLKN